MPTIRTAPKKPTPKQKLLELAARYDELSPDVKRRLGKAIGEAYKELPPRRPVPRSASGPIGRGSAS